MGKGNTPAIRMTIRRCIQYFVYTLVTLSCLIYLFSDYLARCFFTSPDMISKLSKVYKIFACFMILDSFMPTTGTLLRILGLSHIAGLISTFFAGFLFLAQNYVYAIYFKMDYLSPVISLLISDIMVDVFSILIIWTRFEEQLESEIQRIRSSTMQEDDNTHVETVQVALLET